MWSDIRGIANDGVKAGVRAAEDIGELGFPVKDIYSVSFFLVEQVHRLILVEVGTNQGVAALYIASEVGEFFRERDASAILPLKLLRAEKVSLLQPPGRLCQRRKCC